jgi:hypothetical protein
MTDQNVTQILLLTPVTHVEKVSSIHVWLMHFVSSRLLAYANPCSVSTEFARKVPPLRSLQPGAYPRSQARSGAHHSYSTATSSWLRGATLPVPTPSVHPGDGAWSSCNTGLWAAGASTDAEHSTPAVPRGPPG